MVLPSPISSARHAPKPRFLINLESLDSKFKIKDFYPTGIEAHPDNGNFFILSSRKESIIEIIGNEGFIDLEPRMVSEDMAFFHQKVPGSYFYLGAANVEKGINTANHNPRFDFDENALVLGAQAMARVACNFLSPSL